MSIVEPENSIKDLMAAFSCPGRPVGISEYKDFWKSLTPEQQRYYKNYDLSAK